MGPDGRVVGLDFDAVKLEAARRECTTAGLGNIEFRDRRDRLARARDLRPGVRPLHPPISPTAAGAQLYALSLDAGLVDVRVQVVQPAHTGRCAEKGLSLSALANIADAVLAEGLATREELDTTIASLTELTDDLRSVVGLPRIFQVWGRKRAAH